MTQMKALLEEYWGYKIYALSFFTFLAFSFLSSDLDPFSLVLDAVKEHFLSFCLNNFLLSSTGVQAFWKRPTLVPTWQPWHGTCGSGLHYLKKDSKELWPIWLKRLTSKYFYKKFFFVVLFITFSDSPHVVTILV